LQNPSRGGFKPWLNLRIGRRIAEPLDADAAGQASPFPHSYTPRVLSVHNTPSEAAEIGKLVDSYVKAIETTEVLARLDKLEQRL